MQRVVTFDLKTETLETKASGLLQPMAAKKFSNPRHTLYFIVEKNAHQIRVYNETWNQINVIGSFGSGDDEFNSPRAVVISPMNTILVADALNHRIKELTLEGRFLRYVIHDTAEPISLAYHEAYPEYLWVTLYYSDDYFYNVKQFKIYEGM